jgi:hypothetical protein
MIRFTMASYPMKQKPAAIVVTSADDLSEWKKHQYAIEYADEESAAPIIHDGCFLSATQCSTKRPAKICM